jgi:hypothetical protein
MATVTKGRTFVSGEIITPAKLNDVVDLATVTNIQAADIADGQITTVKVADASSTTTGVTNAKLRHSAALSVIGRTSDTAGAPADIAAANDGEVFRRSGTSVGFGTVATAGIADDAVTTAKILNANVTPAKLSQPLTLATAQNTTSGTSIDFTGIPSWVKRITVMFNGVSTNGTNLPILQLGDSGGIETTGYSALAGLVSAGGANAHNFTSGIPLTYSTYTAANLIHGNILIALVDSSTWTFSGNLLLTSQQYLMCVAGVKVLSDTLDRIRLTTVNGTDTFDAGSVNIMYEG